jgi:TPR repeat protein
VSFIFEVRKNLRQNARPPANAAKSPPPILAGRSGEREPLWPAVRRLYRGDAWFRALVDFALAGVIVLAFSVDYSATRASLTRFGQAIADLPSVLTGRKAGDFVSGVEPVGEIAGAALFNSLRLDSLPAAEAGDALEALRAIQARLDACGACAAPLLTAQLPEGAMRDWASAIVDLRAGGQRTAAEDLDLLRRAAGKAFRPAYSALGAIEMLIVGAHDHARWATADAVAFVADRARLGDLDPEQLRNEATLWLERGDAVGDITSALGLGVAQAKGFYGRPNIQAAAAHFRHAALHGSAAAKTELGALILLGYLPDGRDEAERLLREAKEANFHSAIPYLVQALMGKPHSKEDPKILGEIVSLMNEGADLSSPQWVPMVSHEMLAKYFLNVAPPDQRDVKVSTAHLLESFRLGNDGVATDLSAVYRLGLGVEQDLVTATAFALIAQQIDPGDRAKTELANCEARASPDELRKAKLLSAQLLQCLRTPQSDTPPQACGTMSPPPSIVYGQLPRVPYAERVRPAAILK